MIKEVIKEELKKKEIVIPSFVSVTKYLMYLMKLKNKKWRGI